MVALVLLVGFCFSLSGMGTPPGSRIGFWPPRSYSSTSVLSTSPQSVGSSPSSVPSLLRSSCEPNLWHDQLSYAVNVLFAKDNTRGRIYAKRLLLEGFPATSLVQNLRIPLPPNSIPVESLESLSPKIDGLYKVRLCYYEEKPQWKDLLLALIVQEKLTPIQIYSLPMHYKQEMSLHELPQLEYWTRFLGELTFVQDYSPS